MVQACLFGLFGYDKRWHTCCETTGQRRNIHHGEMRTFCFVFVSICFCCDVEIHSFIGQPLNLHQMHHEECVSLLKFH